MKTFTFRYNPKATPKDLFARVEQAAKTGVPDLEKDELSSNSINALLSTMTAGRIQLFYAIANQNPDSMYQLAQLLERDHPNVIRDVKVLEGVGLVKLVAEKDGERERMRPVALYERIIFDFGKAGISGVDPRKKTAAS